MLQILRLKDYFLGRDKAVKLTEVRDFVEESTLKSLTINEKGRRCRSEDWRLNGEFRLTDANDCGRFVDAERKSEASG